MSVKSNNRFLQRVNPQITRGLADSGSSLNHSEIHRLARQMVDLSLWGNLVFWVHEGLAKERVSGADVFCPKMYDISGNNLDPARTDTTQQPKFVNGFLEYENNRHLTTPFTRALTNMTACAWVNTTVGTQNAHYFGRNFYTGGFYFGVRRNTDGRFTAICRKDTNTSGFNSSTVTTINTWYHVCFNNNERIFVNGVDNTLGSVGIGFTVTDLSIGRGTNFIATSLVSDVRIFDKILTATEIDGIFQQTRSKYGV